MVHLLMSSAPIETRTGDLAGGRNGLWHVSGTRFISTALPPGLDLLAHNVQAITMDRVVRSGSHL